VEYYSDGCAGQYKNRKNFYNLCQHKSDFNIEAKWIFFAANHGKQPCDRVGDTVKRLVAKASLQRPYNEQILAPPIMYEFCKNTIKDIEFIYVQKDQLKETREFLDSRFEIIKSPVPGTRTLHEFSPISECKVAVNKDKDFMTLSMKVKYHITILFFSMLPVYMK